MSSHPHRCLVTGADGYIGRHLCRALEHDGHTITRFDSAPSTPDTLLWNITDPRQLPEEIRQADTLFWCAGLTGTSISFDRAEQFLDVNATSIAHLLVALRSHPRPPRIVFLSTRLVYRGKAGSALHENDPLEPLTPYASGKIMAEHLLRYHAAAFRTPYTTFRVCVPYGDTGHGPVSYGTMHHFLSPARAGKPITIFGDGSQRRSLIHIDDLARMIARGGLHPGTHNGTFNIAGPDVLSIREIAECVARIFGVEITSVPWPPEALTIESGDTVFDESRLHSLLPEPYHHRFIDWVRSQRVPE